MCEKDKIIEEQRKTIERMIAHHELALKAATDLEMKLGGVYPPGISKSTEIERAERKEAALRRRGIPTKSDKS